MEIRAGDMLIKKFVPDDDSDSAAIKLQHKPSQTEIINEDTVSPRENLRRALLAMIDVLNPKPGSVKKPSLLVFDQVKVHMPQVTHDGEISKQAWDFVTSQWKYFVDCHNAHLNAWYFSADLDLDDPVLFEDE